MCSSSPSSCCLHIRPIPSLPTAFWTDYWQLLWHPQEVVVVVLPRPFLLLLLLLPPPGQATASPGSCRTAPPRPRRPGRPPAGPSPPSLRVYTRARLPSPPSPRNAGERNGWWAGDPSQSKPLLSSPLLFSPRLVAWPPWARATFH